MNAAPDVTVLIATRERPESLASTLESLEACDFPRDRFDVVVVDNAGDSVTREVCESAAVNLPLRYMVAPEGGKNAALNRGLESATGRLFLFTDDDVRVDPGWIRAMWEGAGRWPDHLAFGGRILPLWPSSPPETVLDTKYAGVAYAILDPEHGEGTTPDFMAFGPNFAVRREIFDEGVRFDPALGPRPGSYIMGGETELLERLRSRGHPPVFLPDSVVHHHIRPAQYELRWLLGRARKWGRRVADNNVQAGVAEGAPPVDRVPGWLYRGVIEFSLKAMGHAALGRTSKGLERAMDAAVELGKIEYLWSRREDEATGRDASTSSPRADAASSD